MSPSRMNKFVPTTTHSESGAPSRAFIGINKPSLLWEVRSKYSKIDRDQDRAQAKKSSRKLFEFFSRFSFLAEAYHLPPNTTSLHLASTVMIYHTLWMLFIQIRDEAKHTRVLKDYSMQSGICSARYLRRYHHTYLHSV